MATLWWTTAVNQCHQHHWQCFSQPQSGPLGKAPEDSWRITQIICSAPGPAATGELHYGNSHWPSCEHQDSGRACWDSEQKAPLWLSLLAALTCISNIKGFLLAVFSCSPSKWNMLHNFQIYVPLLYSFVCLNKEQRKKEALCLKLNGNESPGLLLLI